MDIKFDSVTQGTSASSTISFAHDCEGLNRCVVAYVKGLSSGSPSVGTATYNGVPMTLVVSEAFGGVVTALFVLDNPPTGSQTFAANFTSGGGSAQMAAFVTGYNSGVKQTGQPDSSSQGSGSGSSFSATTNVVLDGSLMIAGYNDRGGAAASTTGTQRGTTIGSVMLYVDSGSIVPAGTQSIGFSTGGSFNGEWLAMSLSAIPSPGIFFKPSPFPQYFQP